jgi:type I restriction enzyme S subunit
MVSLADLTEPRVEQIGPRGAAFTYVDIGSIDRDTKRIVDPKELAISKAPSRAKQVLKAGDVLVSMTRPNLNAVALVPPELDGAVASTGFHVLRARDTEPRYLFYAVQSAAFIDAMGLRVQGALYPAVRPRDIAAFEIPAIPRADQVRLVEEIETQFTRLESGTTALQRIQANLRRYRAAVLKAACEGRLVPAEAELAKADRRTFESGEELLARILEERRKNWNGRGKYKEPAPPISASLATLPNGWAWATVEQLATRVQYGTSAKTTKDALGVPVIRMGNIQDGNIVLDSLKYLPSAHPGFPELLLESGDLLFNRTNSAELVGKSAVFECNDGPFSFASYLIRVRLAPYYLPQFLNYFLNSVFGRAWVATVANQQVGQANVNGSKLQALAVPLPPIAEQHRILAAVEYRLSLTGSCLESVRSNRARSGRLRATILSAAFEPSATE